MARLRIVIRAVLLTAAVLATTPAAAIDWESLVMPGPVIAAHASIEKACRDCHAPFARDEQRKLCLDCHDDIAADVGARRGFHGRSEPARTAQCRDCHTDHEGRKADVTRLDPQTFDHTKTDFLLQGAHKELDCAGCHEPGARHREAPSSCNGCHRDDDVHREALGEDCVTCHAESAWKDTRFEHAKATAGRYPLTGAHAKVECALCHAGQRYAETPTACVACHRIDDAHAGSRGGDCADCHDTRAWQEPAFDHLKETGFALTAGHAGLACQACHAGTDFTKTAGKDCVACHRSDDTHQGRNGVQCKDCHTTSSWADTRFDHARETAFPLLGAHTGLECVACHKGVATSDPLDAACVSCHRADDPHQGALGADCGSCHGEESWRAAVRFDHDLAGFPLVGLHAAVACESCHVDRRYAGTPSRCVDCHRADDTHAGELGERCADCHNPNDWRIWTFDHEAQTRFALEGAHADLECVACHVRPPGEGRPLGRDCGSCHRADDVHAGQFGGDCARCHDTRAFSRARRISR